MAETTYYSQDHIWLKWLDDEEFELGVTAYALEQLGVVTLLEITCKATEEMEVGEYFGFIESVKTCSELVTPMNLEVMATYDVNPEEITEHTPLMRVKMVEDRLPSIELMTAEEYRNFIE